jgi:hypothetical protein
MTDWEDIVREGMALKPVTIVRLTLEPEKGGGSDVEIYFFEKKNTFDLTVARRLGISPVPLLMNYTTAATELSATQSRVDRGTISLTFADDFEAVESYDVFDTANVEYDSGGSFWQLLTVAYADNLYGATVEVFSFYDDPRLTDITDAETIFVGRVENWEFTAGLSMKMKVRDEYALKDISVPDAVDNDVVLASALTASDNQVDVGDFISQFTNPQDLQ